MKNYAREQPRYSRSFNIVQDVAEFAVKVEKAFGIYIADTLAASSETLADQEAAGQSIFVQISVQLFKTLTELASACPANIRVILNSQITIKINRFLRNTLYASKEHVSFSGHLDKLSKGGVYVPRFFVLEDSRLRKYKSKNTSRPVGSHFDLRRTDTKVYVSLSIKKPLYLLKLEERRVSDGKVLKQMFLQTKHARSAEDWVQSLLAAGCSRFQREANEEEESTDDLLTPTQQRLVIRDNLLIQKSISDLLIAFVEGQLPERKDSSNNFVETLLDSVDFEYLESVLAYSWKLTKLTVTSDVELEIVQNAWKVVNNLIVFLQVLSTFEAAKVAEEAKHAVGGAGDVTEKLVVAKILDNAKWKNWIKKNLVSIEIINEAQQLERIYFPVLSRCHNLKDDAKEAILFGLKRESPTDKVEDFMEKSELVSYQIEHQTNIENSGFFWISSYDWLWRLICLLLTVTLNILMLIFYKEGTANALQDDSTTLPTSLLPVMYILGGIHILFSLLMWISYVWKWSAVILFERRKEREEAKKIRLQAKQQEDASLQLEFQEDGPLMSFLLDIFYLFSSPWWFYHTLFLVMSAIGTYSFPVFAFHLLDLPIRNPGVQSVLQAVTTNGKSLLVTAGLGLTVIYLFSITAFFNLRELYSPANGQYCDTLWDCFVNNYFWGLRSGGGIADQLNKLGPTNSKYWGYFFYSIAFHEMIIILLLNMIFGIIVNTFGQLRDEKQKIEDDMANTCTICSLTAEDFQRDSVFGFKHHIEKEHHVWNYLYYFVYLEQKAKEGELTASEGFVWRNYKDAKSGFFPLNQAISLHDFAEDKAASN